MEHKPILAFDCASGGASISLRTGAQTSHVALPQNNQARALVAEIEQMMKSASLHYTDLGAIVTTIGPGSFTGIRIGLAALHGFVLVAGVPIKLLTTLEAMAWAIAPRAQHFTIAIRAGKGELFAQEFKAEANIPTALGEIYLVPEQHTQWAAPCYGNHLSPDSECFFSGPDTDLLCSVAQYLPVRTLAEAVPLYIRPPDAKLPTQ